MVTVKLQLFSFDNLRNKLKNEKNKIRHTFSK